MSCLKLFDVFRVHHSLASVVKCAKVKILGSKILRVSFDWFYILYTLINLKIKIKPFTCYVAVSYLYWNTTYIRKFNENINFNILFENKNKHFIGLRAAPSLVPSRRPYVQTRAAQCGAVYRRIIIILSWESFRSRKKMRLIIFHYFWWKTLENLSFQALESF